MICSIIRFANTTREKRDAHCVSCCKRRGYLGTNIQERGVPGRNTRTNPNRLMADDLIGPVLRIKRLSINLICPAGIVSNQASATASKQDVPLKMLFELSKAGRLAQPEITHI